jgi:hypothetical protein
MQGTAPAARLVGPTGSDFGRALAVQPGGTVLVGAPAATVDSGHGAAYLVRRQDFTSGSVDATMLPHLVGSGGNFGSALGFADLQGNGTFSALVSAPLEGNGTVYVAPLSDLRGPLSTTTLKASLRALAPAGRLGATLGVLPRPLGDALVVGAPSDESTTAPGAGSLFVLRGATLGALPAMRFEGDGRPAAAILSGDRPGDGFGSHLMVGDSNQDGALDLIVAAEHAKTVYVVPGPLL